MAKRTTTKKVTKSLAARAESQLSPALSVAERVQVLGLAAIVQRYVPTVDVLQIALDNEDALANGGWCLRQLNKLGEQFTPEEQLTLLAGFIDQATAAELGKSFTDYLREFSTLQPVLETQDAEAATATPEVVTPNPIVGGKRVITPIRPGPADFDLPPDAVDDTDIPATTVAVDEVPPETTEEADISVVVEITLSDIVVDRINARSQPGGASAEMIVPGTERQLEALPDVPFIWPDGQEGAVVLQQILDVNGDNEPCGRLDIAALVVTPSGEDLYLREDNGDCWEIDGQDIILSNIPAEAEGDPAATLCGDVCVRFVVEPTKAQPRARQPQMSVPKPATAPSVTGVTPVTPATNGKKAIAGGPRRVSGS